jgi:hypothetical protein
MKQAGKQLGQGKPQAAQQSMQQAAEAMQKAGEQLAQQSSDANNPNPGAQQPATSAQQGKGEPNTAPFAKDLAKHAGKSWGELPGELRTKIIQEMKAQYGDDYARVIKLYFEQIADRK